jgi:hypothetical protein
MRHKRIGVNFGKLVDSSSEESSLEEEKLRTSHHRPGLKWLGPVRETNQVDDAGERCSFDRAGR